MKKDRKEVSLSESFSGLKNQNSLVSGVIIALVILSALFLVKPKVNEILGARKTIKNEREKLALLTQKAALLESLNQVELNQRVNRTLSVLPVEKDVTLVLSSLKAVALETDLTLFSIGVNPGEISSPSAQKTKKTTKPKTVLPSYTFSLQAEGKTEAVKAFIQKIEKISPLLELESLSLSLEDDSVEASIEINAFYLDLPEVIGPYDKPLPLLTKDEEGILQKITGFNPVLTEGLLPFVPSGKENPFAF